MSKRDAGPHALSESRRSVAYPKVELHVHLEATVRVDLLAEIARRNGMPVPGNDVVGLTMKGHLIDFDTFMRTWITTSSILQRERDFREVVVDYAGRVAEQGCRYVEAIFSPSEPVRRGSSWQEVFEGYANGAQAAREEHGVEVRFTPDITRNLPVEVGEELAQWAVRYRDRGIVGLGLSGSEDKFPPELFAGAFAIARYGGLPGAPHAGEMAGPESVRGALAELKATRLRHGVRAIDDVALVDEIAARGIVCDVTPTSNLLLGVVPSLAAHPLPRLLAAGVRCSVSTDDPVLMGIDLAGECERAVQMGHDRHAMYEAGIEGAFCDEGVKRRLRAVGEAFDWQSVAD